MNIDKELLSGLLYDDTTPIIDRVDLIIASKHKFGSGYKKAFDFVVSHIARYKKVPAKTTFKKKFPKILVSEPKEPLPYYIEEAIKFRVENEIKDTVNKIDDCIVSGDLREAVRVINQASSGITFDDPNSTDINVSKEFEKQLLEYKEFREKGIGQGILTGFSVIDDVTNGFQDGEFIVLAARPRNYKTFMMVKFFAHCGYTCESNVILFSREMTQKQIQNRLWAILGGVSFDVLRRYQLADDELDKIQSAIKKLTANLIIVGSDSTNVFDLTYVRNKILDYGPCMTFVDGMYMVGETADWKDQTIVTRGLRQIALQTSCPILSTTQLNRKGLNLDNIAYSDSAAQDASIVIGQERIYDDIRERLTKKLKVVILKNRDGEDEVSGIISLGFNESKFVEGDLDNLDDDDDYLTDVFKPGKD